MSTSNDETKIALRQYNKCPCGGNDETFGRALDKNNRWQTGISIKKHIEKVTGFLPSTCPWWYLQRDPFVGEVLTILKKAEINPGLYNTSLPNAIYEGVSFYKGVYNKCKNHWYEEDDKKRREKERTEKTKAKASIR